jgi:NAD(P)H-binding
MNIMQSTNAMRHRRVVMSDGTILVTSAAGGQQGQPGRHVSELLLARGIPVRAFVHTIDQRAERLRELGAEVVQDDFLDLSSVRHAVRGIAEVYFAYPVQDGLLEATAIMSFAAREARVQRLVDLEMLISSPDAPTPRMRQNLLSEQVFETAQVGAVHVRATVFFENLRSSLDAEGTINLPWGSDSTLVPLWPRRMSRASPLGCSHRHPFRRSRTIQWLGRSCRCARSLRRSAEFSVATFGIRKSPMRCGCATLPRGYNAHAIGHLSQLWYAFRMRGEQRAPTMQVTRSIQELGGAPPKAFEELLRNAASTAEPHNESHQSSR